MAAPYCPLLPYPWECFCCPYTLPLDAAKNSNICLLSSKGGRSLTICTCSHTVCPRSWNMSTKYDPTAVLLQSKHEARLQSRTELCYQNRLSTCSQHPTTFQTAATYYELWQTASINTPWKGTVLQTAQGSICCKGEKEVNQLFLSRTASS